MADPEQEIPEQERQSRAIHRFFRAFYNTSSYGVLLLMIVGTYLFATTVTTSEGASLLLVAQIATVWLALRTSQAGRRLRLVSNVIFALALVVAVVNIAFDEGTRSSGVLFLVAAALYFCAPIMVVRHLGFRHDVDEETMLGALAAYLLIGMAFAMAYRSLAFLQDGPFFGASGEGKMSDDLFFSFVTLTTTGYGNLVPAKNPGQTMAVFEALIGQLFLVVAVAKVVNAWTPRRWPRRPPGDADAASE